MRLSFVPTLFALIVTAACGPDHRASSLKEDEAPPSFKVLTYNTYQLTADPNGSPTLNARRALLADALAATDADVLILQELWPSAARDELTLALADRGYAGSSKERRTLIPPYFYGNGLYVYVKKSLGAVSPATMTVFAFNDMINFDYATNKGAIKVRVDSPDFGAIDVVAAHTSYLAFDGVDYDYARETKLLNQIRTIGVLMNDAPAPLQILGADVNTNPKRWNKDLKDFDPEEKSGVYKILTEDLGLTDTMAEGAACDPCFTWDNENNQLIRQGIFGGSKAEPSQRLDYMLYRGSGVKVTSSQLAMEDEHPFTQGGQPVQLPLSDHFAVLTTLTKTAP